MFLLYSLWRQVCPRARPGPARYPARRLGSAGVHAPEEVTYPRKCAFIFTTLESRSMMDPFDVSASIPQFAESPGTGPNFDEPNLRVAAGHSARLSRADPGGNFRKEN